MAGCGCKQDTLLGLHDTARQQLARSSRRVHSDARTGEHHAQEEHHTAMHAAARGGHANVLTVLLEAGGQKEAQSKVANPPEPTSSPFFKSGESSFKGYHQFTNNLVYGAGELSPLVIPPPHSISTRLYRLALSPLVIQYN